MGNLLATVIDFIRQVGGLRRLLGFLPPAVQLVAAVTTLVLAVAVPVLTLFGDIVPGRGNGGTDGTSDDPLVIVASDLLWMAAPGLFDVDRLELGVVGDGSLGYDVEELYAEMELDSEKIRPVGVGEDDIFLRGFTVANRSQQERAIVRAVSLRIEDFEPPPESLLVGCAPGIGGVMEQEEIEFEMQLNSESVGVEQRVSTVPGSGTVLELGPNNLQAFKASLSFSAPGLHTYRIVVHYDTSAGRSRTAVSEPLEVLVMPSVQGVEWVRPAGSPPYECRPGGT